VAAPDLEPGAPAPLPALPPAPPAAGSDILPDRIAPTPDPQIAALRRAEEARDWAGLEALSRGLMGAALYRPFAVCALGRALFWQNRGREALEPLEECQHTNASERALAASYVERVRRLAGDEEDLRQQRAARFHLYYDGERHETVEREVLRTLERHYATLSSTLQHQPAQPIPVVLLANAVYDERSLVGTLGVYQHDDNRILIRMQGLEGSLSPQVEETLMHELTHAFAGDMARIPIPRDVNEGLAQYMEGSRNGQRLYAPAVTAIKHGGGISVWDFYLAGLSFVEHLIGQRGMGGICNLLRKMNETGDVDEAFRQVYGRSYNDCKREWIDRVDASPTR
jgi:hypothetical protein